MSVQAGQLIWMEQVVQQLKFEPLMSAQAVQLMLGLVVQKLMFEKLTSIQTVQSMLGMVA